MAKLGMKFQSHLDAGMPLLEDLLVGVAVLVSADDGVHPVLRLDSVGRHSVGAGSSQQAILGSLVAEPLSRLGLGFRDVDKYATELHNPEITEPAASGDVPAQNYRLIAALAVLAKQIAREDMPQFVRQHGMPGFSPTKDTSPRRCPSSATPLSVSWRAICSGLCSSPRAVSFWAA